MKSKTTARVLLGVSGAALLLCALPALLTLLMSFQSNPKLANLYLGDWVGLDAYRAVFADAGFWRALRNTVLVAAAASVLLMAVILPAAAALGRIRRIWLRLLLAAIPMLIYLLPLSTPIVAVADLTKITQFERSVWMWLYLGWFRAAHAAPFALLALVLLDIVRLMRGRKLAAAAAFVACACGWYAAFCGTTALTQSFRSDMYAMGITLPNYTLRMMNGAELLFSSDAVKRMAAGLLGKGGLLVIALLGAKRLRDMPRDEGERRFTPAWLLGLLPCAAMVAASLLPVLSMWRVRDEMVAVIDYSGAYLATILYIFQPLVGVALGACLAAGLRGVKGFSARKTILLAVLLLSVTLQSAARYLLRRDLGLMESMLPSLDIGNAAALALLAVSLLWDRWGEGGHRSRNLLLFCGGLTLLLFAAVSADSSFGLMYATNAANAPVALVEDMAVNRVGYLDSMLQLHGGAGFAPSLDEGVRYLGLSGFPLLQLGCVAAAYGLMGLSLSAQKKG